MNTASSDPTVPPAGEPEAGRKPVTHTAQIDNSNRSTTPKTEGFLGYVMSGWAEREDVLPAQLPVAAFAAERRRKLGEQFPGERIIIGAGVLKQRSNDTFYMFRPHTAFAYLTGWGSDSEPGAVLVLDPLSPENTDINTQGETHTATLYFRERAARDSDEFFANPEIGEFWIGPRPSLEQVAAALNLRTAPLASLDLSGEFRALEIMETGKAEANNDPMLARVVSEMRLVKDDYELEQMQLAVDATAKGFDDAVKSLQQATQVGRGERIVEGAFHQRARLEGNGVGYETISASGNHACTLHWIANTGTVREGELLLLDAGVELDSLYTADITRTLPISGTFSDVQRKVYQAVLDAADAAFSVVKPGVRFGDVHDAAMQVIERTTREWGLLPDTPNYGEIAYHRRYMVHGTSHHLGLDVHDCAQARRELYLDGILKPGMVFTIEPGLYFHPDDLTVPQELRGIGVRIEDDIVVTETGASSLSADIPRTVEEVEKWVRALRGESLPA